MSLIIDQFTQYQITGPASLLLIPVTTETSNGSFGNIGSKREVTSLFNVTTINNSKMVITTPTSIGLVHLKYTFGNTLSFPANSIIKIPSSFIIPIIFGITLNDTIKSIYMDGSYQFNLNNIESLSNLNFTFNTGSAFALFQEFGPIILEGPSGGSGGITTSNTCGY